MIHTASGSYILSDMQQIPIESEINCIPCNEISVFHLSNDEE